MRFFFFLVCLLTKAAHSQIFADFSTTLGDFTVELDYENSPKTVANFVILAEGSRPWINSTTGEVQVSTPFYDGITFHRVIDEFIIQAGSPNGLGTDGPGYVFPDEVTNGLAFDEPYLFAMANSGPNSNGSQFFITEGIPTNLNGIHTIFGSVSVGEDIVDLIHATPVDAGDSPITDVVINSLLIRRVGEAAEAFDEFAEELPIVSEISLPRIEISADGSSLITGQPAGSSLTLDSGTDLIEWTSEQYFLDRDSASAVVGELEREFYRIPLPTPLVTWPVSAPAPASYRGMTLDFTIGATLIQLVINDTGLGTITFDGTVGQIIEFREEFTNPYGASLLVFSDTFAPFRFRLGADDGDGGRLTGTLFTLPSQSFSGSYMVSP